MRLLRVLCVAVLPLTYVQMATAQEDVRSKTTGLLLGIHLNGSAAKYEDADDIESGGGLGLTVGYGFTRSFTLFANADVASLDFKDFEFDGSYGLAHFDLGGRFSFGAADRRVIPYVEGAISGRAISSEISFYDGANFYEGDLETSGTSATLGGGLEVFFNPALALNVALKYSFGSYTDWTFEGEAFDVEDVGSTTTRFNIGLSWRPGR